MSWWREFADSIEPEVPLGPKTWFRVGGRARLFCRPRSVTELTDVVRRAREESEPVRVLGAGANVLIHDDGVDGVVIRLDDPVFQGVSRDGERFEVGAGVDLIPFARRCSYAGWSGLEGMAGIPATVGGAVRMNAGGRFGEMGDVVADVEVLNFDGSRERLPREALGFGYRYTDLRDRIILSATLNLHPDDSERVRRRFEECQAHKQRTQPLSEHSAGCIFKNPPGQSAGALIDRAGLKGLSCGGAQVSDIHANFIVARENACVGDILRLIDLVRERVRGSFSVELQPEVEVWGPVEVMAV